MLDIALYSSAAHEQFALTDRLVLGVTGKQLSGEADAVRVVLERVEREGVTSLGILNLGPAVLLPGGERILPGGSCQLAIPAEFQVGKTTIYVQENSTARACDQALATFPRLENDPCQFADLMQQLGGAPSAHTLAYWFDALGRLQQSPAGSHEFYQAAAQALFDPGGLDAGLILTRVGDDWRIEASYLARPNPAIVFRKDVLQQMVEQRHTLFHDSRRLNEAGASADGYVVAAPVIDAQGHVIGAVYSVRFNHQGNHRRGIRPLEVQFVQAVADAVSAGQMRLQRESEVLRLKTRLELTFSPAVAHALERNPKLLEGTEREVTVLFSDLRGFTSLCEQLTPRQSYALLTDVMDCLTMQVAQHAGLVLDYFGDGMAAFWNAPVDQPEHAVLACQAAQQMFAALGDVSRDWQPVTGQQLRLGIGIHTGTALVGNAGSRSRIKYGPRGTVVNLASRVQGATKVLSQPLLITRAVADRVHGQLPLERLLSLTIADFEQPVELFTIANSPEAPTAMTNARQPAAH